MLNESSAIQSALMALQPLRRAGVEVIVIDGGSQDATMALARPLASQVVNGPRGRALQMNIGASLAAGDALLFLHADTVLPSDALQSIQTALSKRHWGRFDVRITGQPRLLQLVALMMNLRSRLSGIATGDQAIFCRSESFQAINGYPQQPLMEDIELSRRLKRLGPPACLRGPVITSGRRWEQHGLWRTILLMWRLRLLYWLGCSAQRLAHRYPPCNP